MKSILAILPLAAACIAASAVAQQPTPPPATQDQTAPPPAQTQQPPESLSTVLTESAQPLNPPKPQPSLATVSLEGVSLTGAISVQNGLAIIGNDGAITAGDKTARLDLTRGGNLSVCAFTKIHLSSDNTIAGGGLMIAIDHGAFEAHYPAGQFSDVLLTPDLRILISPPGQVDLSLRVNNQGDTCVDNHGDHAPYVLASSLFQGGAYRVQPNQRVLFEHGSLEQVVDDEKDPCGCPPLPPIPTPTSIAGIGAPGTTLRATSQPAPAPTPAAAQNPFPLAESQGLQPPPAPPSTPVVLPGEAHLQVTAPLAYNGENPEPLPPPPAALPSPSPSVPPAHAACSNDPLFPGVVCDSAKPPPSAPAASKPACGDPLYPGLVCDSDSSPNPPPPPPVNSQPAPTNAPKPKKPSHGIGHFFRKIFGGS
ncbi:MAG: hypothetical protein WBX06_10775 [Acidobacteriaceae bacterium]